MHLPPPLHGVTICSQTIVNSKAINCAVNARTLPIRYGKTIVDMQSHGLKKIAIMCFLFFKLLNELIRYRPDTVYFTISPVGFSFYRDLLFVSLIKLFSVNIVYHMHGKGIANRTSKLERFFYRYTFRNSTIICMSNILSFDVDGVKANAKIEICANGIEDGSKSFELSKDKKTLDVVYISNLSRMKGVDVFLDVVARAAKDRLPIKFHLVGPFSKVYREQDLNEFLELNPEAKQIITYHGALYEEEKWSLLSRSDVLMHPTRNDAFPLVILEGLASGNVVLATGEGGIPDMLRGLKGSKVTDTDKFYSELVSLLNNKDELEKHQAEAREHFKHYFSKETFEKRILEILLNA